MGFPLQTVLLLLARHREEPLEAPLLTLGRQQVNSSYAHLLEAFSQAGIEPRPLSADVPTGPYPGVGEPWETNDVALFAHLGLEVQVLDGSSFEGAEIVHDLNQPVPDYLRGRFRTIIDGGTLEHVFDVRQAFANIAEMLAPPTAQRPGGQIIHITPCNNYVNHGFWQPSPTAFFDYYEANGFTDLSGKLVVHPRDEHFFRPWHVVPYDPDVHGGMNSFFSAIDNQLVTLFTARKTAHATSTAIPTQSFYRRSYAAGERGVGANFPQLLLEYGEDGELRVKPRPIR